MHSTRQIRTFFPYNVSSFLVNPTAARTILTEMHSTQPEVCTSSRLHGVLNNTHKSGIRAERHSSGANHSRRLLRSVASGVDHRGNSLPAESALEDRQVRASAQSIYISHSSASRGRHPASLLPSSHAIMVSIVIP